MALHNILIVDDEYYICEGLHKKLVQLNHPCIGEILTCLSGEEAISVCKTYKPHIIFTDIKMSGINGIELIHALRELSIRFSSLFSADMMILNMPEEVLKRVYLIIC